MILKAIIDDQEYKLEIPDAVLAQGEDLFAQLDADMDKGWQMSREWVNSPDRIQRCQIVANKLLTALEKENEKLGVLMAGYILSRMPGIDSLEIDTHGEVQNTQFTIAQGSAPAPAPAAERTASARTAGAAAGMNKLQAMEQAGNDVTKVFKIGKGYRFSIYDRDSSQWRDSPLIATEQEAERLRQEAFKSHFEALQRAPT